MRVINIATVNVTPYVKIRRIDDILTREPNTCSFTLTDTDGTHRPISGQEIIITDGADKLFAGIIVSCPQTQLPGNVSSFVYECEAVDYTRMLDHKLVVNEYSGLTLKEIVNQIMNAYSYPGYFTTVNVVAGAPTINNIKFNYQPISECFQVLADLIGWDWYVDYDKDIHFFPSTTNAADFALTDTPTFNWKDLNITIDTRQVRNRIFVRGGTYLSDYVYINMVADGEQSTFDLPYKASLLEMRTGGADWAGGAVKTVGVDYLDDPASFEFMHNYQEKIVKLGTAGVPAASTVIRFKFKYMIPVRRMKEDTTSQATIKAIEGGDGIYEYLVVDDSIMTNQAADDRADAELTTYANAIISGSFVTVEPGFKSGQLLTINITNRAVDTTCLIQSVYAEPINSAEMEYVVTFATTIYGLRDFLKGLYRESKKVFVGNDEVLSVVTTVSETAKITDGAPSVTEMTPPQVWSNDGGTTPNKMRWGFFQWG